jgi:MFS family permease
VPHIGVPTFDQIGLAAAVILFCLRMVQGLCLGGQYGGAITYVAEHVSDERRGYYTGWLQTSPTLGIVLSLAVIIVTRRSRWLCSALSSSIWRSAERPRVTPFSVRASYSYSTCSRVQIVFLIARSSDGYVST